MIEITNENYTGTLTPRLVVAEVIKRGWKISRHHGSSSRYLLTKPDGHTVSIFGSIPPTTTYMAYILALDKFAFYEFFITNTAVPLPETVLVDSVADGMLRRTHMIHRNTVVVKPLDGSHGMGVTTGIISDDSLAVALSRAFKLSSRVILQQQIDNAFDIRILVINGKVSAALNRIPATVVGNGSSTIMELIDSENSSVRRGGAYTKPLSKIMLSAARPYLGVRMKEVPAIGIVVQVVGVANMGVGGETRDVTDDLPEWLNDMAIGVCAEMSLGVAGVDVLIAKSPKRESTRFELNPYVIEVNTCPSLFIHEIPTDGRSRPVVSDYVDYLDSI